MSTLATGIRVGLIGMMLATANSAAGTPGFEDERLIHDALDRGTIDTTEAIWLRYLAHFEPDQLSMIYQGESSEPWRCSTALVQELRENWVHFSAEQQAQISARLAPWKDDFMAPLPKADPEPGEGKPRPEDTCWGQQGAHRITGDHFAVEWDSNGVSENTAQLFLDALETSWEVEVEQLGWRDPDLTDEYLMWAYIEDPGPSGAYTSVEQCGNQWMAYMVAGAGGFGDTWYQAMSAHEFGHTIQFGYGGAHQFFWWEASAMYISSYVFPNETSWIGYLQGYTNNPWMAHNTDDTNDYDRFLHMYGMMILANHLDQHVGGSDLVRLTWEESEYEQQNYSFGLEDSLPALGYDWDEAYLDFVVANTVMDYSGPNHPSVSLEDTVYSLPAEGSPSGGTQPETRGQNYIRFEDHLATPSEPHLWVSFEGEGNADWAVLLVGIQGDSVVEVVEMDTAGGQGEAILEDLDEFDETYLVISPLTSANSGLGYSWRAEAVPPGGPTDDDDDDDDDTTGDDDDDDTTDDDDDGDPVEDDGFVIEAGGGCNCRTADGGGAAPAAGLFAGLILGAVAIRRRR